MRYAECCPMRRLFYWAIVIFLGLGCGVLVSPSGAVPADAPKTTTISDTVYFADGSGASGTLIITWPAFMTADGTAVAAGATSSTLGPNGALSVALIPNAGATPAGVYYTVIYQLGPQPRCMLTIPYERDCQPTTTSRRDGQVTL
jgi:hypothetical protein